MRMVSFQRVVGLVCLVMMLLILVYHLISIGFISCTFDPSLRILLLVGLILSWRITVNYSIISGILLTGKLNFSINYYSSLIVHVYMYIVYTFVDSKYHTRQFIGESNIELVCGEAIGRFYICDMSCHCLPSWVHVSVILGCGYVGIFIFVNHWKSPIAKVNTLSINCLVWKYF